jgi:hypothetical protein
VFVLARRTAKALKKEKTMRWLTLLLAGCVVLSVGQAALAFLLTGYTPGDPLSFHFNGVDTAPFYALGGPYTTPAACLAAQITKGKGLINPGTGLPWIANEDAWGIAKVSNITDPNDNTIVYWTAGPNSELSAMFVGTWDQSVSVAYSAPGPGNTYDVTQDTYSNNFKVFLFEDATPDYNAVPGPAARNGAFSYPTATDGTLVFEAVGVKGLSNPVNLLLSPVEHTTTSTLRYDKGLDGIAGTADDTFFNLIKGSGSSYVEIADANGDSAITGQEWNNNMFDLGGGVKADLYMSWTLTPPIGFTNWDTADQDPVQSNYVPEPVTMASLFLGIGCLSRYIRKRR